MKYYQYILSILVINLLYAENQTAEEILLKTLHRMDGVDHQFKVDSKNSQSCPRVNQEINFSNKAINKLSIKEGNRKDFKLKNIKVSYLKGLRLRYFPLTQKKVFTLIYKFRGKSRKLVFDEFILDH